MKEITTRKNGTIRVQTIFDKKKNPGKTQQSFKDECDINRIMKRYAATGNIKHIKNRQGAYLDLTDAPTFEEALNIVKHAEYAFESLDSAIRKKFNNNPEEFLEFMDNPNNNDEAVKLGLKVQKQNEQTQTNETKKVPTDQKNNSSSKSNSDTKSE